MEKRIVHCEIREGRFMNTISVVYDDGSVEDGIGSYYPDELYYSESDFVGLTRKQACNMMTQKDTDYLRR